MLARTKTRPTDNKLVSLTFKVHVANVERIKRYVNAIEPEQGEEGSLRLKSFSTGIFQASQNLPLPCAVQGDVKS